MENQNKEGDSDSRESYALQISELLKALAEMKSPPRDITHIDPRNISATLSILKKTEKGTSNTPGCFRSRAILPEHISKLSLCQFKRWDPLSESLSASLPVPPPITAAASSQEGQRQPRLPSSKPVGLAFLVEKYQMLPSDSISSIRERLEKHEMYPHILGVQAWSKQQFPQTGKQ